MATLASLFAATVEVEERRLPGDPGALFPEETHYVRRAVAKRIAEFAAGRACARAALGRLGVAPAPIPAGADRAPLWPRGFVGTITHTKGWCAAAVARDEDFVSLGLDSEVTGAPTADIWPTICGASELTWVHSFPSDQKAAAVTLLFSAKEAFYKCQYPITGEWLDFHDLNVEVPRFGVAGEFHRESESAPSPPSSRSVLPERTFSVSRCLAVHRGQHCRVTAVSAPRNQ